MNMTIIYLGNYLMRAVCFGGAALLAYYDKPGWGWLIFAGIITSISNKSDDSKQSNVGKSETSPGVEE